MKSSRFQNRHDWRYGDFYALAMSTWVDWFLTIKGLRRDAHAALAMAVLELDKNPGRVPGSHSDPTLAGVIAEERAGWSVAVTVDGMLRDMRRRDRLALVYEALGHTQSQIGTHLGLSQSRVSVILRRARAVLTRRIQATTVVIRWLREEQEKQRG